MIKEMQSYIKEIEANGHTTAYSFDGEYYEDDFDLFYDNFLNYDNCGDSQVLSKNVYIGRKVPRSFLEIDIADELYNRSRDEFEEAYFDNLTKEQANELNAAVKKAIDDWAAMEGNQPKFYDIEDDKCFEIKVSDIEVGTDYIEV